MKMPKKVMWSVCLLFVLSFPALSQEPSSSDSYEPVPFTTIEPGQTSHVSEGDAPAVSTEAVIRDQATWTGFWEAYTQGREPRPELPYVDFDSEMIIVSSRGKVAQIYADHTQGILRVIAGEITPADPSLKTTDPFHIIKTERVEFQSVVFDHHPLPRKVAEYTVPLKLTKVNDDGPATTPTTMPATSVSRGGKIWGSVPITGTNCFPIAMCT